MVNCNTEDLNTLALKAIFIFGEGTALNDKTQLAPSTIIRIISQPMTARKIIIYKKKKAGKTRKNLEKVLTNTQCLNSISLENPQVLAL